MFLECRTSVSMSSTQGCSGSDRGERRKKKGGSKQEAGEMKGRNELIESQFPSSLPVSRP
jgi:hypothetical protein